MSSVEFKACLHSPQPTVRWRRIGSRFMATLVTRDADGNELEFVPPEPLTKFDGLVTLSFESEEKLDDA